MSVKLCPVAEAGGASWRILIVGSARARQPLEALRWPKRKAFYSGRPASTDVAEVRTRRQKGVGATEMGRDMKIGRASVYRHSSRAHRPDSARALPLRP